MIHNYDQENCRRLAMKYHSIFSGIHVSKVVTQTKQQKLGMNMIHIQVQARLPINFTNLHKN